MVSIRKTKKQGLLSKETMNDKIKLQDMTLAQIKELKTGFAKKIESAVFKPIEDAIMDFQTKYDVGDINLTIHRTVQHDVFEFETSTEQEIITIPEITIHINFSKEDE